ncbi:substrate-binding periplasmic protein [Undibacterium sp.]|uniref:substrate-binding periplasmic protein n=1 Tax=Undibacterium sp. TaxID=1914977 RepID=UPI002C49B36A|nr:transporter substrate-binding domain-containing protein [Undibacterium sp.]HTD03395.1 transporter substrate-binding domain-containing protein [Undibacterium sp.]
MRVAIVLGFLCLLSLTSVSHATAVPPVSSETVSVCVDAEPPPWAYWKRDANGNKTRALIGSSVETVQAAFARIGKAVQFDGDMPWKRCLLMVEGGKVDFAMDGYFDAERARRFDYSIHYNTLTPQVFFRAADPLAINHVSDLRQHRGCGVTGASYAHYGLLPDELDLGSGYDSLVRKLNARRCDYFVEELEIVSAYKMIGIDYLSDPSIRHAPVPGAKAPSKYLLTTKSGRGSKLLPQLNEALAALIKSGEAAAIWKRHSGSLPYLP